MSVAVECCSFVTPGLYIGDKYACRDLDLLKSLQIRTIINCTVKPKAGGLRNYYSSDFLYKRVPVKDSDLEDLTPWFSEVCELVDQSLQQKFNVLIHCQQGVSRSATIVLAYLLYKGNNLKNAYVQLKTARPIVKPKTAFLRQLVLWDKQLSKKRKERNERKRICSYQELPNPKRKKIVSKKVVSPPINIEGPTIGPVYPPPTSNPPHSAQKSTTITSSSEDEEYEVMFPPQICP